MRTRHRMPSRCNRLKGCRFGCCVPDRKQPAGRRTRRIERAELRQYLAQLSWL